MTKEKELALGFKLVRINTEEFAIIEEAFDKNRSSNLSTQLQFGYNNEKRAISVTCKFQFQQEKKPFLIIAAQCIFEMKDNAWKNLADDELKKITIPLGFASHLAMVTVGTIRGILHEKTQNTYFNRFILPPVDLTRIIKDDIVLEHVNDQEKVIS